MATACGFFLAEDATPYPPPARPDPQHPCLPLPMRTSLIKGPADYRGKLRVHARPLLNAEWETHPICISGPHRPCLAPQCQAPQPWEVSFLKRQMDRRGDGCRDSLLSVTSHLERP